MSTVDRSPDHSPDAPSGRLPAGLLPRAPSEWMALAGLAAVGTAFVLSPAHIEDGPVLCPFRLLTGLECPGCGLTRSFVYLAHGWWGHAATANPFGVVLVAALLALAVGVVVARVRRSDPPDLERLVRTRWIRVVLAAWLAFAVARVALSL